MLYVNKKKSKVHLWTKGLTSHIGKNCLYVVLKHTRNGIYLHAFFRCRLDKGGRSALSLRKEPRIPIMPQAVGLPDPRCKLKRSEWSLNPPKQRRQFIGRNVHCPVTILTELLGCQTRFSYSEGSCSMPVLWIRKLWVTFLLRSLYSSSSRTPHPSITASEVCHKPTSHQAASSLTDSLSLDSKVHGTQDEADKIRVFWLMTPCLLVNTKVSKGNSIAIRMVEEKIAHRAFPLSWYRSTKLQGVTK